MKFKGPSLPQPKIQYLFSISLFNVVLVLLVLFVFSSALVAPSGLSVVLPHSVTGEPLADQGVVVTLLKDGSVFVGNRATSLDELKKILPSEKKWDFSVLIKADRLASVGALTSLLDFFREAGARKVTMATNE